MSSIPAWLQAGSGQAQLLQTLLVNAGCKFADDWVLWPLPLLQLAWALLDRTLLQTVTRLPFAADPDSSSSADCGRCVPASALNYDNSHDHYLWWNGAQQHKVVWAFLLHPALYLLFISIWFLICSCVRLCLSVDLILAAATWRLHDLVMCRSHCF